MKVKPEMFLISFLLAPLSLGGCISPGSLSNKDDNEINGTELPSIDLNMPPVVETATFALG